MTEDLPPEPELEEALASEGDAVQAAKRNPLKVLLRVAIGFAVVGLLVFKTPPGQRDQLVESLKNADMGWVALGALFLFLGLFVSAFRWRAYLDALEIDIPQSTVVRLYFVGTFFNAFLPSGVGGDAYKAVRIGRRGGKLTPALASVFLDRFAGFVALGLLGLLGTALAYLTHERDKRVALIALALSCGMLFAAGLLMLGGERLLGRGRLIKQTGAGGKIRGAVRAIHEAGRHPPAAARGFIFGLVFVCCVVSYHLCVARSIGIVGVPPAAMIGIVVIASLATMIPLSPGGLGFREAAYVYALHTFGVGGGQGRAFALLILAVLLLTSAVGGIVYVVAGGEVRRPAAT